MRYKTSWASHSEDNLNVSLHDLNHVQHHDWYRLISIKQSLDITTKTTIVSATEIIHSNDDGHKSAIEKSRTDISWRTTSRLVHSAIPPELMRNIYMLSMTNIINCTMFDSVNYSYNHLGVLMSITTVTCLRQTSKHMDKSLDSDRQLKSCHETPTTDKSDTARWSAQQPS